MMKKYVLRIERTDGNNYTGGAQRTDIIGTDSNVLPEALGELRKLYMGFLDKNPQIKSLETKVVID